jgi:hypothetical protein
MPPATALSRIPQTVIDEVTAYMQAQALSSVTIHLAPDGGVKIEKTGYERRQFSK